MVDVDVLFSMSFLYTNEWIFEAERGVSYALENFSCNGDCVVLCPGRLLMLLFGHEESQSWNVNKQTGDRKRCWPRKFCKWLQYFFDAAQNLTIFTIPFVDVIDIIIEEASPPSFYSQFQFLIIHLFSLFFVYAMESNKTRVFVLAYTRYFISVCGNHLWSYASTTTRNYSSAGETRGLTFSRWLYKFFDRIEKGMWNMALCLSLFQS